MAGRMESGPGGIQQPPVGRRGDLDLRVMDRLRRQRRPEVRLIPDRPEIDPWQGRRVSERLVMTAIASSKRLDELLEGLWRGFPLRVSDGVGGTGLSCPRRAGGPDREVDPNPALDSAADDRVVDRPAARRIGRRVRRVELRRASSIPHRARSVASRRATPRGRTAGFDRRRACAGCRACPADWRAATGPPGRSTRAEASKLLAGLVSGPRHSPSR